MKRVDASEVLRQMDMDCGPITAEPYSSWAKDLARQVIELKECNGKKN